MIECNRCLLNDSLPRVSIDDTGLCSACREHERAAVQAYPEYEALVRSSLPRVGPYDAIVAFSGGKDSAATLSHLAHAGLSLRAVLFDNGFIPREVVDQAATVARTCQVDLDIVQRDLTSAFRASFIGRTFEPAPCSICMAAVWKAMDCVAGRYGTTLVCSGHRYPPGVKQLSLSNLKTLMAVPVAARLDAAALHQARERVGYREVSLGGQSTNCQIPQAVEAAYADWYGFNPAIFELSKEVRCGLASKAEARRMLDAKSRVQPNRSVLVRLGVGELADVSPQG